MSRVEERKMLGERSGPVRGAEHVSRPLTLRAAVSSSGPARAAPPQAGPLRFLALRRP
jgi:hypothetical protein